MFLLRRVSFFALILSLIVVGVSFTTMKLFDGESKSNLEYSQYKNQDISFIELSNDVISQHSLNAINKKSEEYYVIGIYNDSLSNPMESEYLASKQDIDTQQGQHLDMPGTDPAVPAFVIGGIASLSLLLVLLILILILLKLKQKETPEQKEVSKQEKIFKDKKNKSWSFAKLKKSKKREDNTKVDYDYQFSKENEKRNSKEEEYNQYYDDLLDDDSYHL